MTNEIDSIAQARTHIEKARYLIVNSVDMYSDISADGVAPAGRAYDLLKDADKCLQEYTVDYTDKIDKFLSGLPDMIKNQMKKNNFYSSYFNASVVPYDHIFVWLRNEITRQPPDVGKIAMIAILLWNNAKDKSK